MSTNEPFHDPADLLDELDAIIREQESLRHRTVALAAKYRSLGVHADRFDKPGPTEWSMPETFGRVNVETTAGRLGYVHETYMDAPLDFLYLARESACKVREYPRPEREQAGPSHAGESESDRGTPSSALADHWPGSALTGRGEADRGDR